MVNVTALMRMETNAKTGKSSDWQMMGNTTVQITLWTLTKKRMKMRNVNKGVSANTGVWSIRTTNIVELLIFQKAQKKIGIYRKKGISLVFFLF